MSNRTDGLLRAVEAMREYRDSLEGPPRVAVAEAITIAEDIHEEATDNRDHRGAGESVPDRGRSGDGLRDAPADPFGGVRGEVVALVKRFHHERFPSCEGDCSFTDWLHAFAAEMIRLVGAAPSTPEPSGLAALLAGHARADGLIVPPLVEDANGYRYETPEEFARTLTIALRAAPSTEPALDRGVVVRAVHDWFCGESVDHGDRRRPSSGWVCERGADAIIARLAESQS